MPELPEVETTVEYLREKIEGEKIIGLWSDSPKLFKGYSQKKFKEQVVGEKIEAISRRAKYVIFHLSSKKTIVAHQRMSGHFLVGKWEKEGDDWIPQGNKDLKDRYNQYLHVILKLASGKMLALSTLRKFSTLSLYEKEIPRDPGKQTGIEELDKLGPEPFSGQFSWEYFKKSLKNRRAAIKTILMNQEIVGGIGNIYSDEILWRAKTNPERKVNKLADEELKRVYKNIRPVLKKALKLEGTSTSDYRKPSGQKGGYTEERKVYQREDEPCPRCGAPIERVKISGRSAHFCPQCQN
jgi:formamidopyrimidine-DNA glycosylase